MSRELSKRHRALIEWRKKNIREPTPAEFLMAAKLHFHGIEFEREYPILTERSFFTADFYCSKYGLLIEVDGGHHQYKDSQIIKDMVKDCVYKAFGYHVLRIKNNEVEDFEINRIKKYKRKTILGHEESNGIIRNTDFK